MVHRILVVSLFFLCSDLSRCGFEINHEKSNFHGLVTILTPTPVLFSPPVPELKSFVLILMTFELIWNNLLLFMSRQLRRLLVRLFQILPVVGMLPKLWLDICILSLIRGIHGTPLFLCKIRVNKSFTFGGTV